MPTPFDLDQRFLQIEAAALTLKAVIIAAREAVLAQASINVR